MNFPNPLDAIKKAPGAIKDTAEKAVEVAKDAPGVVAETAEDTYKLGAYLVDNPPDLGQVKRTTLSLGHALLTGERTRIEGEMPPYPEIDPAALEKARERGEGRSIRQRFIASDETGKKLHEPVNVVVKGSREELEKALESQGWMKAPGREVKEYLEMGAKVLLGTEKDTNGPVSEMFLDGRKEAMAFNKNDDYNAGRDHMRVYHAGKDPETGEDTWEIAATRDVAATVTIPRPSFDGIVPQMETPRFGHEIDHAIDGERDLIMHDLLASGLVKDWAAVPGERSGVSESRGEDGRFEVGDYTTDGRVYEVRLGG